MQIPRITAATLESRNQLSMTLFWLALIVILKHDVLLAPPVWDTAMGVFPPAIYLYENGFDVLSLLKEPNWWEAGPNVHSLSLVTWVIALVMNLTGDATHTFLVLHSLTFILTAFGMTYYVRLVRSFGIDSTVAFVSAFFVLAYPLVLVQVGYMYTEVPVMVCSVVAVDLCRRNRFDAAIFVCAIALFIKLTAVALALSMAIAALAPFAMIQFKKWVRFFVLLVLIVFARLLPDFLGRVVSTGSAWGSPELLLNHLHARMVAVPDLAWLVLLSVLCSLILLSRFVAGIVQSRVDESDDAMSQGMLICLLYPVIFSILIIVGSYSQTLLLPRYLVPVVPFSLLTILLFLHWIRPGKWVLVLLLPFSVYFVANYNGSYYPPNLDSFSVVERSHAYQEFNAVKAESIEALNSRPDQSPAWVTREISYMMSHPRMGYVDSLKREVFPILVEPWKSQNLDSFPDHFYLLRASTIHGGRIIGRLIETARSSGQYEIGVEQFSRSGFQSALYELKRRK